MAFRINFNRRQTHLQEQCKRLNLTLKATRWEVRYHMIVDQRHSVIYCHVEKVGCTFWKRILALTSGLSNASHFLDISGSNLILEHKSNRLTSLPYIDVRNYTTFMFARDPYTRLLSGYVDKIYALRMQFNEIRQIGIRIGRPNAPKEDLRCATDVTFREHLLAVVHMARTRHAWEPHFYPIYEHCSPCKYNFDFLGKFETFSQDSRAILSTTGLDDVLVSKDPSWKERDQQNRQRDDILDIIAGMVEVRNLNQRCLTTHIWSSRLWSILKIRGYVPKQSPVPMELKSEKIDTNTIYDIITMKTKTFPKSEMPGKNKMEAIIEAYASIPEEDLKLFQEAFSPDFELYGYPVEPDYIVKSRLINSASYSPKYFLLS